MNTLINYYLLILVGGEVCLLEYCRIYYVCLSPYVMNDDQ